MSLAPTLLLQATPDPSVLAHAASALETTGVWGVVVILVAAVYLLYRDGRQRDDKRDDRMFSLAEAQTQAATETTRALDALREVIQALDRRST